MKVGENVVLVVDDDADTLEVLRIVLEDLLGVRAVLATSGEQALQRLQDTKPALVLLDLRLPGIDGLELARQLKSNSETKDIPLMALTAWSRGGEQAIAAGCDDCIEKPFDLDYLTGKLAPYVTAAPDAVRK